MKKYLFYVVIVMSFLCAPSVSKALDLNGTRGKIVGDNVLIAKSANLTVNGNCLIKKGQPGRENYAEPGNMHCLDSNNEVIIKGNLIPSNSDRKAECPTGYYYVNSISFPGDGKDHYGYVCADNIATEINVNDFADEFRKSGIPEIYWDKLAVLKKAHPNWKFTGYNTGLDWNEAIKNESVVGLSYIQGYKPELLSLDEGSYDSNKKEYIVKEGSNWYAANKDTVAYYMDPRNFFDSKSIFMFENLAYNESYQTLDVILKFLTNTPLYDYSSYYIEAAKASGVSPIMLSALSKQEVVKNNSLSNAANGTYDSYNFYNLGAYSSCENPVECGAKYAKDRGWTTPQIAIVEGAKEIADGYILNGQNTLYFKKFNVTNNIFGNYSHQYQTNIKAPSQEGNSTANSYAQSNSLDSSFEFVIPVYKNMPSKVSELPTKVNEEELKEKEEEKHEIDIATSINNAGYTIYGSYLINVNAGTKASDMLSKIGNGASITSDDKNISGGEILGTADVLHIANNSYRIIINGDLNGDGNINAVDYVKLYKYVMQTSSLSGSFKQAADLNKDGNVDAIDMVKLYKAL